MDNLCHTLAGAAIAEARPFARTPLAAATLMIGANLPDLDALAYVFGDDVDALAFRRGWTHGILAMVLLPVILACTMLAFDRLVRRRRRPDATPARWRPLLLLAGLGILSHPILDLLNTYGVRLLAPFSWKWFYGDALFIVDPWVWLALSLGIVLSRRRAGGAARNPERPARVALLLSAAYAIGMMLSGVVGRTAVARTGEAFQRQMVGPLPLNPFERQVVLDLGDAYRSGALAYPGPRVTLSDAREPKGAEDPLANAAARTETGRKFLSWSRFPIFKVEQGAEGGARVVLQDARYPPSRDGNWASAVIALPEASPASPPP